MKQRANQFIMNQRGFSLVELSIVLVILGLLVGGVLSGQSLIRASELRKLTTTNDRYQAAIMTFRDKYFGLPGDTGNATAFWGTKTATSCRNNAGAAVNAANGTCDGDADGLIFNDSTGGAEAFRTWEQLSLAGLIEGAYRYSSTSALTEPQRIGVEFPAVGIGRGGMRLGYVGVINGVNMTMPSLHGSTGNFLKFGAASIYQGGLSAGIIRPDEAYSIDSKIDDGRPGTGAFLAHYDASDPGVTTNRCVSSFDSPNANYNLTFTNNGCSLWFRVN